MKKTFAILTLTLAAFAASAERFTATPSGNSVTIEGTSTLHAWTMTGTTIKGEVVAPSLNTAKAVVAIPVTSIHSEHAKMDSLMADALKAKANPEIRYELTEAAPANSTATSFVLKTHGKLTIAGVTRDVTFDVQGIRTQDGGYAVTGQAPIRMSAFGIKPPTAMMGTIKTGDDVKVTFRWTVAPAK